MDRYYILQTFPKKERQTVDWLKQFMSLEAYYPTANRTVKPRNKKGKPIDVESPVFVGYVFVKAQTSLDWYALQKCHYIYGYLCNDGIPSRISPDIIETMMQDVKNGKYDDYFTKPDSKYSHGEAVLIQPSDVTMLGTIIEISNKTIKVQVHATGKQRCFTVPINQVVPAKIVVQSLFIS